MIAVYPTLDAIPEALRPEYEEKDGKFVLKLEGSHPVVDAIVQQANAKVGEFRDTNVRLLQEKADREAALKAFEGIDPAQVKADREALAAATKNKGKDQGALDALTAQVTQLTAAVQSERDARAQAVAAAAKASLTGTITQAGIKAGVLETALPDFINRGMAQFEVENGLPVAKKDGTLVYSQKHPGQTLTVDEWAANLQAEASHLYKPSNGGAATPGNPSTNAEGIKYVENTPESFRKYQKDIAAGTVKLLPRA